MVAEGADVQDIICGDGYLMFDVWHHDLDGEDGKYLRLNFYVTAA